MSGPENWAEIIARDACDGMLPAVLPVHWDGPDGPVIGRAEVTADGTGVRIVVTTGEPPWDGESSGRPEADGAA